MSPSRVVSLLLLRRSACRTVALGAAAAAAPAANAANAANAPAAAPSLRFLSSSGAGAAAAEAATTTTAAAAAAAEAQQGLGSVRFEPRRGPPPPAGGSFISPAKPWLQPQQRPQQQQHHQQQVAQQQQQQQQRMHGAFMPADDPWYGAASSPPTSPQQQQQQQQQQQHWRPSAALAAARPKGGDTGGAGAGLGPVDWSSKRLPPIQAVSPPAAAAAGAAGAAAAGEAAAATAAELQRLGIKVEGAPPLPGLISSFEDAGLCTLLLRALKCLSLEAPSLVQQIGWPCCFSGRDIIAISQTGSGKTLGFLIPAFMHLLKQQQQQQGLTSSSSMIMPSPTILVLGPTRELVAQIHTESQRIIRAATAAAAAAAAADPAPLPAAAAAAGAGALVGGPLAKSVAVYGGASRPQQVTQLRRGADIVIATPGRLLDLVDAKALCLQGVSYVVLDEADRMMDMGFEPQVKKILSQIRPDRQMLLWSATWPSEVQDLSREFCRNAPIKIQIGSSELQANPNIEQVVEVVGSRELHARCVEVLRKREEAEKALVFCATKREAEQLSRELRLEGLKALAIHGDKSQRERDRIISDYRRGHCSVLVATDVASRGLDIRDIRLVLNYAMPPNIETYIHRIGRTGRAQDKGKAVTLFVHDFHTPEKAKLASALCRVMQGANQQPPEELIQIASSSSSSRRSSRGGYARKSSSRLDDFW